MVKRKSVQILTQIRNNLLRNKGTEDNKTLSPYSRLDSVGLIRLLSNVLACIWDKEENLF